MPRKPRLTPLQNRILWALEEAGGETFRDLLNEVTLSPYLPGDRLPPSDWAAMVLVKDIETLMRVGYVKVESVVDDANVGAALRQAADELEWREDTEAWRATNEAKTCMTLEIVLTDAWLPDQG